MTSIRRRLVIQLLISVSLVWIAMVAITYDRASHRIEDIFDAQLAQTAKALREVILVDSDWTGNRPGSNNAPLSYRHRYEKKISFQLWRHNRLLVKSFGAPDFPLAGATGFSDQIINDARWRVFGLQAHKPGEVLYVGEVYEVRNGLVRLITVDAVLPIVGSIILIALFIWFGVGSGLKPLRRVANSVAQRSPQQLDTVKIKTTPAEIRPLVVELNSLFRRLQDAFAKERRFTADAAHEMRTPLSVIKIHAQIAARAEDPEERNRALRNVIKGVDRTAHLVLQMLTLARLEPDNPALEFKPCSLFGVATSVKNELAPMASTKDIVLDIRREDECVVLAYELGLTILLRNLMDNAIRYTPPGGRVRVDLRQENGHCHLRVVDSGPGVPAEERERVFERFYRSPGRGEVGAGLGLSIVRRICELHQASITVGTGQAGEGLSISVALKQAGVEQSTRALAELPNLALEEHSSESARDASSQQHPLQPSRPQASV